MHMGTTLANLSGWLRRERVTWPDNTIRLYLPRFLVSIASLLLLVEAALAINWPTDGVTWRLVNERVEIVAVEGPAVDAGVRPGDVVLTVNGQATSGLAYPDQAGQRTTMQLLRNGQVVTVELVADLPNAENRTWRFIPVATGFAFWLSAVIVFAIRPAARSHSAYFALALAVTVILAAGQLSGLGIAWAGPIFNLALLSVPLLLLSFQATQNLVHFVRPHHARTFLLVISLVLTAAYVAIRLGTLPNSELHNSVRTLIRVYVAVALFGFTLVMAHTYFTTTSGALRRRVRGLVISTALGFVPLLFLSLLPDILWGPGAGVPYQISFLFLLLIPIVHAYVIVKHDLSPLDRFLNRSLVVFTLGLIWATLFLLGTWIGVNVFQPLLTNTTAIEPLVGALVTMVLATMFIPLRDGVQKLVDRLFYGGWYDYRTVIAQVSRALGGVTQREALAERLVPPTVEGLRLRGAALYLHLDGGDLTLERTLGLDMPESLSPDLVRSALGSVTTSTPIRHTNQHHQLNTDGSVAWYLPLVREEQLMGLLVLGKKRDDDFFEAADLAILSTLSEQAALAASNVLLMSNLEQALQALETAQQRLLTAREEERRTLAWDLHDGPVQDLLALGYQLCECRDQAAILEPTLAQTLERVRKETNRIMGVTRNICGTLRSDVLDVMGIDAAMAQVIYNLMQKSDVVVYLDVSHHSVMLADPLGISLFKVFQEALNNALVHAQAKEIWVSLLLTEETYELQVWDEGRGFNVPMRLETLALKEHFGLVTMRERMAAIHGQLEVTAAPGQGTRVRAWGPVHPPVATPAT
jgi:signal transduction histidine kinase